VQQPLPPQAPPSVATAEFIQPLPTPSPNRPVSGTTFITIPWRLHSDNPQALTNGATLHEMRFTSLDAGDVELTLISFDRQACTLRVIDQPNPDAGSGAMEALMIKAGAIAGVNGGYFHPDFSPLGLLIAKGEKYGSFTRTSLVSGMVRVADQSPALIWNDEYRGDSGITDLIQCGPRLVEGGEPIAGLNATKTSARSFVATDGAQRWFIGRARYTTLRGLSDLLATPGLILGTRIDRALNLDGGRSTALYARRSDGSSLNDPGWSTVRNYLAIVPK
jgi:Phosphodiester glycosidase